MATFTLYLPDKLVEEMDALRMDRSRSGWIRDAVEIALGVPPKKLHAQVGRVYPGVQDTPPPEAERNPAPPPEKKLSKEEAIDLGRQFLGKPPLQRPIVQKRH